MSKMSVSQQQGTDNLLEQLMYNCDGTKHPDDGINRLYQEIKEHWNGNLLPGTQYGLKEAWDIISRAEQMDVAFAVRANLTFNGFHDDDSPIHGKAVTFRTRDCLHIKAKYNEDWWIGRVVKEHSPIGFIPAPLKLKKLSQDRETIVVKQRPKKISRIPIIENFIYTIDEIVKSRRTQSQDKEKHVPKENVENIKVHSNTGSMESLLPISQSRVSEVDSKAQGPYDAVPVIRPIILCGPSIRGFEITDLMHKALIHALRKQFEDRLEMCPVDEDCLKVLHSSISSNKVSTTPDGLDEITDKVFGKARGFKLLFVDLKINSPLPLRTSALAPILVHIKISNLKVLQSLIKQRGPDQKRGMTAQVYAATKLNDLDRRNFDVVLGEHEFNDAADHLMAYLEKYWRASRPYQSSKKHHESILRNTPGIISKLGIRSPYLPGRRHSSSSRT